MGRDSRRNKKSARPFGLIKKPSSGPPPTAPPTEDEKKIQEEVMLRRLAVHRLEQLPPYQPANTLQMEYNLGDGRVDARLYRGETKRERAALAILCQIISTEGMPVTTTEDTMKSLARRAIVMSEIFLQTINGFREQDLRQMYEEAKAMFHPAPSPPSNLEIKKLPDEEEPSESETTPVHPAPAEPGTDQ